MGITVYFFALFDKFSTQIAISPFWKEKFEIPRQPLLKFHQWQVELDFKNASIIPQDGGNLGSIYVGLSERDQPDLMAKIILRLNALTKNWEMTVCGVSEEQYFRRLPQLQFLRKQQRLITFKKIKRLNFF